MFSDFSAEAEVRVLNVIIIAGIQQGQGITGWKADSIVRRFFRDDRNACLEIVRGVGNAAFQIIGAFVEGVNVV